MTNQELLTLIEQHATAMELGDAGKDAACAEYLVENELTPVEVFENRVTERGLYDKLGPTIAETILQKLEATAESNAVVKRALKWLQPSEGGLDLGNAAVRAMLDQLATAEVLTAEERDGLKAIGERHVVVTAEQVSAAYLAYRPNGKIVPIDRGGE